MYCGLNKRVLKSIKLCRYKILWFVLIYFLLFIAAILNVASNHKSIQQNLAHKTLSYELDDGITDEAKKYIEELGLKNPGENGEAVIIPETASDEIKRLMNDSFEEKAFNAFISNMVSLNRNIPDWRNDICKNKIYHKNLPKCSVMITVHNEDWMLLMRTIHSVLLRSPSELLEEILIIDDASVKEWLHKQLDDFVSKQSKVRLIRSPKRLGIINARNLGSSNAIGPIIINLDSHVEVSPGWLEPLLDRFVDDNKKFVGARISGITRETLALKFKDDLPYYVGGVQWDLSFSWETFEPLKTATLIGPTHAISKDFFMELGMYDPEYGTWGGEDMELSIKVWLCGGTVEQIPCSRTAHMYKKHKYTHPDKDYRWNTNRIAEIWLDEYKRFYYRAIQNSHHDFGNITERIEIKNKNKCKPFKWFLDNVYNIRIPDDIKDP
ncbi:CLUMA_CG012750, isoform A [Clunio marinus]|uniref:CLUMA_CG012750, isoform A n=1 Tax=Clunio marinus TaxID=568069 RepID=A0A1J1IIU3_9DIPT|nr:CLUMA_CG012750, isoform A [Clunio marinus]